MVYSSAVPVAETRGIHGPSSSFLLETGVKDMQNLASFQGEDIKSLPEQDVTANKLLQTLDKAEQIAKTFDRQLRFELREEAGLFQVEVLDLNDDKKVIRKIPPDGVVNFIAHVREMLGAMIDINA